MLWTVPNTFVASANCARYCGAASISSISIPHLELERVACAKSSRRRAARRGCPRCWYRCISRGNPPNRGNLGLAREYGFRVVEDASHAVGASRSGEPVGSCRWSDITVLSFHPVKIITSGEGGVALTNDPKLAERMTMLRTHGITRDPNRFLERDPAPWHYEQQMLGFNYRMTDIHATLGISQLARLKDYVERRNALAARYDSPSATSRCNCRQFSGRTARHFICTWCDCRPDPRGGLIERCSRNCAAGESA